MQTYDRLHVCSHTRVYLICRQTFFVVGSKLHEPIPTKYSVRTAFEMLSNCTSAHNPQKQKYDTLPRKDENAPRLKFGFGPKRTKAKRADSSQLCNLRRFRGRRRYRVTLLFAHKTNVKREAKRTHKLKCHFTVSVHARFPGIMILYSNPVHVILSHLFHR